MGGGALVCFATGEMQAIASQGVRQRETYGVS